MGNKVINEEWRPVPGFESLYAVSNLGNVKSLTRYKKTLKLHITNAGYYQVQLWHNGVCKPMSVHRLVAMAFIGMPSEKQVVNHIDENKLNNNVSNLEWITHVENCRYGTAINRRTQHLDYSKRRINNARQIEMVSKPIAQFTREGEFIRTWKSASECHRATGITISNIREVAKGRRNTAGGFVFKEVEKCAHA